jgi:hypothetical protein
MLDAEPSLEQVIGADAATSNQLFMLGDDIRESALALAGIEAYLARVQTLMHQSGLSKREVHSLIHQEAVDDHVGELDDALQRLQRTLVRLKLALGEDSYQTQTPKPAPRNA